MKKIFVAIEKWIDNLGDSAITSSDENTEEIYHYRSDRNVETVLDGANCDYYRKLNKDECKRELELPLDKKIVVYTGAMMMNKGIQFLLEAIPMVLAKDKNVYFVVAGFPAEDVEKFVEENKLSENVRIVSPLNYFDLPKLLVASDIGVDPKDSSTKQASGKILQYMAAGLPVVCFDRTNNRNYLEEGGHYCAEISAASLAESILELAENSTEISYKGQLNKKQITKFSWDISAEKIEKIYNN